MKKDPAVFVQNMLDCIEKIESYSAGKSESDFINSKIFQDAVIWRIEMLGQAAAHVPETFRAKHSHIPWKKLIATRDKLVKEYFQIDLPLTWKMAKETFPLLKKQLQEVSAE
ncbi:MAG: DUF86 domain-containing protein [Candidatus Micrarchaeota archaeon]